MGNINSTDSESKKKSLPQVIDYIATNYILTQNFQDLKSLSDQTYCDKLVVLTSKVIAKKLNNQQIKYLAQRLKEGVEINEMTKDDVIYLKRDDIDSLDVKNSTQKRRLCIGIAKYYVKIAHLFAAIITTINPVYTYRTEDGLIKKVDLVNKDQIPPNAETKITRVGICSNRINALLNNQDFFNLKPDDQITVNPKFCSMNTMSSSYGDEEGDSVKRLSDEPGIPELKSLYLDVYDYDTGKFKDMSPNMKKAYNQDLELFYQAFTGNKSIPKDANNEPLIKSFSDIKLRDYSANPECETDGAYTKKVTGSLRQKLFKQYAEQVKKMIQNAENNQNKLLDILDEVFVFTYDPVAGKKEVIINPRLTEDKLQVIIEKTRNIIVNLYLTCEKDFIDSLEIFEAIIEKQIFDTSVSQLHELEKSLEKNMIAVPVPIPSDGEEPPKTELAQQLEQQLPTQEGEQRQEQVQAQAQLAKEELPVEPSGAEPVGEVKAENVEQAILEAKEAEVGPQQPVQVPPPQIMPIPVAAFPPAGLIQQPMEEQARAPETALVPPTTAGITQKIENKLQEETNIFKTQLTKAFDTTKQNL